MSYHGLMAHQRSKGRMPSSMNSKIRQQQDMLGNDESDDNEGELWLEVRITEAETAADYSGKSQQVKKGYKPRGKRYEGSQQQDMLGKSGLESNQKDFNRDVHNLTMAETAADYSDKSQQVCDCGWSKWTTDRGLRTHQVKKGCKPRGKRYEGSQQQDMLGKSGLESNQKDFNRDVHNLTTETAADYSDKSQQVCDCGWSKWTTDRGLRTHQVKKGCKPRGKRYEGSQQQDMLENGESDDNEGELWLEVNNTEAETAADYSDKSQQVKKGYKPRGKRCEGSQQQDMLGKSGLESNQEDFNRDVHNLTTETAADYSDKSQQVCDCGWSKWTTDRGLRTHQVKKGCKPRGKRYEGSQQQDMLENGESDDNEGELLLEVNNTEAETAADYSGKSQQVKKGRKPRGKRYAGSQQQDMLGKSGLESNQKDFNRDVHNLTTETAADYSDKSQQVKKGCKPRGKRYEGSQQQDMLENGESDDNEGELLLEVNNTEAETAADYSDKSQQVCDCGWSKWTTDRGLRTHQVKKGCKPRGKSGLKTNKKDDRLDVHNLATDEQVCFCGWSKWTTYHGLRTHQGLKGCTPKGLKIPQSDQHFWKTQWKAMHPQRMTFRKEL
nr:uncharacterized protein LOC109995174 isoform X3 [Labrus bergylta]